MTASNVTQDIKLDINSSVWKICRIVFFLVFYTLKNLLTWFFASPKSLKGKVCLVTGSGRGLGREICIALAKEGAILACADINQENNNQTVEILRQLGAKATAYNMNVANKQSVEEVCKKIEKEQGALYLLVNNAAIVVPAKMFGEKYIRSVVNVNLLGAIWTTEAVLGEMKRRNQGHIVFISSIAAVQGFPEIIFYSATKAAIRNYSHTLALGMKLEGYSINVSCVLPSAADSYADITGGKCIELMRKYGKFCRSTGLRSYPEIAKATMKAIQFNRNEDIVIPWHYYGVRLLWYIPGEVLREVQSYFKSGFSLTEFFSKFWDEHPNDVKILQAGMETD